MQKPFCVFLLLLVSCIFISTPLCAVDIYGKSTSVVDWYDGYLKNEMYVDFYQYIRFDLTDITSSNKLTVHAYGRYADNFYSRETTYYDLLNEEDRIKTEELKSEDWIAESRLYYCYVDLQDLGDKLDVRLGRQFVFSSALTSIVDGVHFQLNDLGPLSFRLWGGGDVSFYKTYYDDDLVGGVGVSLDKFDSTDLGISYVMKYDEGDMARQMVGLNFLQKFPYDIQVYSELQYDFIAGLYNEVLGGIRYKSKGKWLISAEYFESIPVFDATSIYSVFAVDDVEVISLRFSYQFNTKTEFFTRMGQEQYESFDETEIIEVGTSLSELLSMDVYVSALFRNGEDILNGGKLVMGRKLNDFFRFNLGLEVDQYDRLYDDMGQRVAQRYWIDSRFAISKTTALNLFVENSRNDEFGSLYRARCAFVLNF